MYALHGHQSYTEHAPCWRVQEFLAGTLNLASLNKAENLKAAFESFDIDGDGKITREELQAGLKVRFHPAVASLTIPMTI